MAYLAALFASLGTVFCLVPPFRTAALRTGFLDRPTARKAHREPVPLLGGAAIFAGSLAALFLFLGWTPLTRAIGLGGALLVGVGLLDDAAKSRGRECPVWPRAAAYAVAASIPLWFGIQVSGVRIGGHIWTFGDAGAAAATMLWVFAMINMMNFIDGADGLASGIAVISSATLLIAAAIKGETATAVAAAIVAGAAFGFLLYNFYPAKMFMGDAGATFLGYALAVIAVDGAFKRAAALSVFVPLLALGVPIMDAAFVFCRRVASGRKLYRGDRLHTHHTLLRRGLSQRQAVTLLYAAGAIFSFLSILLLLTTG